MSRRVSRRSFIATSAGAAAGVALRGAAAPLWAADRAPTFLRQIPQRVVAMMIDGFDPSYVDAAVMPTLARWAKAGVWKTVDGMLPSVTNCNNATINTGRFPSEHGITGNSFLAPDGTEAYMESGELLRAPTAFQRLSAQRMPGALLSSKKKSVALLKAGAVLAYTPEEQDADMRARFGAAPPIYSGEINHHLLAVAADWMRTRPDVRFFYLHTTDYPMHMWPPSDARSLAHLRGLDAALAALEQADPDAAFCISADHGMNAKTAAWDLVRACEARGTPIRAAVSTGRDKYLAHHAGYSGSSFVYLKNAADVGKVQRTIASLPGVEAALPRADASRRWRLMPERIGDLVVTGDVRTVFGTLAAERIELPADYRNHGSAHEQRVPLLVSKVAGRMPPTEFFVHNRDLIRWMWDGGAA